MEHGQQVWSWSDKDGTWQIGFIVSASEIDRMSMKGREYVFFLPGNYIELVKREFVEDFGFSFLKRYKAYLDTQRKDKNETYATAFLTLNLYIQLKMERRGMDVYQFKQDNAKYLESQPKYWIQYMLTREKAELNKIACVSEEFIRKKLSLIDSNSIPGIPAIPDWRLKPAQPPETEPDDGAVPGPSSSPIEEMDVEEIEEKPISVPDHSISISDQSISDLAVGQYVWVASGLANQRLPGVLLRKEMEGIVVVVLGDRRVEQCQPESLCDFGVNFKHCFIESCRDRKYLKNVEAAVRTVSERVLPGVEIPRLWPKWALNNMAHFSGVQMETDAFAELQSLYAEPVVEAPPPAVTVMGTVVGDQPIKQEEPSEENIDALVEKIKETVKEETEEHEELPVPEDPISNFDSPCTKKRKISSSRVKDEIEEDLPLDQSAAANESASLSFDQSASSSSSSSQSAKRSIAPSIPDLLEPLEIGFKREIVLRSKGPTKGDVYYYPPPEFKIARKNLRSGPDVKRFLSQYAKELPNLDFKVHFSFKAEIRTGHQNETLRKSG